MKTISDTGMGIISLGYPDPFLFSDDLWVMGFMNFTMKINVHSN